MKEKLTNIYTEQAQTIAYIGEEKEKKKQELKSLEEEEIKLMEEINRYHTKEVETKKQYLAALSLPVREVANAMRDLEEKKEDKRMNKSNIVEETNVSERGGLKLPNANLNQAKLKLILKQLKKSHGQDTSSSRYT